MGRRIKILLTALLLLTTAVPVNAASIKSPYLAEQAQGKAPNVTVYMTGSKMQGEASVSGKIKNISLSQNGEILPFEQSGKNISYIILMDNSGSVNQIQFEESKNQLIQLRQSLKKGDRMTLYTVGTDSPEGQKTQIFTSPKSDGVTYQITWDKITGADGYEVELQSRDSGNEQWSSRIITVTEPSYRESFSHIDMQLKARVRAFRKTGTTKEYGDWSQEKQLNYSPV